LGTAHTYYSIETIFQTQSPSQTDFHCKGIISAELTPEDQSLLVERMGMVVGKLPFLGDALVRIFLMTQPLVKSSKQKAYANCIGTAFASILASEVLSVTDEKSKESGKNCNRAAS
jgi:hypothetical protein